MFPAVKNFLYVGVRWHWGINVGCVLHGDFTNVIDTANIDVNTIYHW